MKILVIGAGVIGTMYAWQLSEAGHELSVLVRKGKKERLVEDGFHIHYSDDRQKPMQSGEVAYQYSHCRQHAGRYFDAPDEGAIPEPFHSTVFRGKHPARHGRNSLPVRRRTF